MSKGWHHESKRHALASKGIKTATNTKTPINTIDRDNDGIVDWEDCDPNDITEQDAKLNKTQIQALLDKNIYVTDDLYFSRLDDQSDQFADDKRLWNAGIYNNEPKGPEYNLYRFPTKESEENAREAHYKLMAMLKKYPSTFNAIMNTDFEHIAFTSKNENDLETHFAGDSSTLGRSSRNDRTVIIREPSITTHQSAREVEQAILSYYDENDKMKDLDLEEQVDHQPYYEDPKNIKELKKRRALANSLNHEFKHLEQFDTKSDEEWVRELILEYEDRPHEIEAKEHAFNKQKELETPGKVNATIDEGLMSEKEHQEQMIKDMKALNKQIKSNK